MLLNHSQNLSFRISSLNEQDYPDWNKRIKKPGVKKSILKVEEVVKRLDQSLYEHF